MHHKTSQHNELNATQRKERVWFIALTAMTALAFVGHWLFPLTPDRVQILMANLGLHAHLGAHHFVDQRSWLGIPNAADVLSNLPFAAFGAWGLWHVSALARAGKITRIQVQVLAVFFYRFTAHDCGFELVPPCP